jgi:hypothetical protein
MLPECHAYVIETELPGKIAVLESLKPRVQDLLVKSRETFCLVNDAIPRAQVNDLQGSKLGHDPGANRLDYRRLRKPRIENKMGQRLTQSHEGAGFASVATPRRPGISHDRRVIRLPGL